VPYEIHLDLPNRQQAEQATEQAIKKWNSYKTPVSLKPRESQDYYVKFVAAGYSSSRRGCIGGPQKITLTPEFSEGTVLHEIGHAVGLAHEHNRHDRNRYLERICWENISPQALAYFQQRPDDGEEPGEYDFESIMHYSKMAFSRNRYPTIVPRMDRFPCHADMGQRKGLSEGDIQRLHHLYRREAVTPGDNTHVPADISWRAEKSYFVSIVRGSIVVPPDAAPVKEARAVVRIRDLAYSDAPERQVVAESIVIADVAPDARIGFSIDVPNGTVAAGLMPSVEVHIDLDGSGYFSLGDLISMEPHWVLPTTPDAPIDVPVSVI